VANALTYKHKELKMQKVKSNTTYIITLINPRIIINAVKATTLEINHQQALYKLVNSVLQAN